MLYATQDDLVPRRLTEQELVELTDDGDKGVVNAALVTSILTESSALVDAYCRKAYTVPLQASEQIKGITISIALYKLMLRRRRVNDDVRREYDDAIVFLRDVAAGKASLDQPANATPQVASTGGVVTTQKPERFSDDNLEGFV